MYGCVCSCYHMCPEPCLKGDRQIPVALCMTHRFCQSRDVSSVAEAVSSSNITLLCARDCRQIFETGVVQPIAVRASYPGGVHSRPHCNCVTLCYPVVPCVTLWYPVLPCGTMSVAHVQDSVIDLACVCSAGLLCGDKREGHCKLCCPEKHPGIHALLWQVPQRHFAGRHQGAVPPLQIWTRHPGAALIPLIPLFTLFTLNVL